MDCYPSMRSMEIPYPGAQMPHPSFLSTAVATAAVEAVVPAWQAGKQAANMWLVAPAPFLHSRTPRRVQRSTTPESGVSMLMLIYAGCSTVIARKTTN